MNRRYVAPPDFPEADLEEEAGPRRLIVGISGASGVIYGTRLLELLRPLPIETHLVISRAAEVALAVETDLKPAAVRALANVVHAIGAIAAPISSARSRRWAGWWRPARSAAWQRSPPG